MYSDYDAEQYWDVNNSFFNVLDQHPPFYPYNTFAQRDNNCEICHRQVFTVGWYWRFLRMINIVFRCEDCNRIYWHNLIYVAGKGFKAIRVMEALKIRYGPDIVGLLENNATNN